MKKSNSTLMNILKNNWDSPLEYVVSLFNVFCNTNITENQIRNNIQYLQMFLKKQHKCSC
jgi:hypothetical protein